MAAALTKVSSSVVIVINTGKDANGKDTSKKLNLGAVTTTAPEQDIYDVASAIGNILNYPVQTIQKVDNNLLTNE